MEFGKRWRIPSDTPELACYVVSESLTKRMKPCSDWRKNKSTLEQSCWYSIPDKEDSFFLKNLVTSYCFTESVFSLKNLIITDLEKKKTFLR